ncbi:acetyltransferase [Rhizobium sp. Root73]|uniref:GNAT family N-acetyltransferase n=1 Tax=unclassified Rhizobium TaxID=2613769 RepID=UPI0007123D4A|nr:MULTISPECIES: GNAT family N-acetyltransferase [unclassified Rhizobium]KQV29802.1 acetyltransferase [Rhizobium sp. Root1204]KQY05067.1 acetyltransferase [Rhizobium sp. Root1334]KRC01697.1 acetyltransferase [Rhizobium sp. Root73]
MQTGDFRIRPATPDDLPALLSLYRHLNPDDPEMASDIATGRFAEIIAQPGMTLLIGVSGENLTSSVTLVVIPNLTRGGAPYALIENVVTHAEYRKRGHARTLITDAFQRAWDAGCYKVMLLTGSKEPATLRFYEGCGFVQNKTGFQIRRPAGI